MDQQDQQDQQDLYRPEETEERLRRDGGEMTETHRRMNEGWRRWRTSVRYGEEGEAGEEQRGCGWAGEEASLWWGGQKRGRGYHVSCKEAEAGLLCQPPLTTGLGQEELRRDQYM